MLTKARVALGKNYCIFAILLKKKNLTKLVVSSATHVSEQTANKSSRKKNIQQVYFLPFTITKEVKPIATLYRDVLAENDLCSLRSKRLSNIGRPVLGNAEGEFLIPTPRALNFSSACYASYDLCNLHSKFQRVKITPELELT